nr:RNA-dependent RNA polymerase [Sarcosphaera coronaria partitivirus]
MCLTRPTNLRFLRYDPFYSQTHRRAGKSTRELDVARRTVKKSLYKHLTPEKADHIINGFRRSDGSDEAAEQDFLRTDEPYHPVPRDSHYRKALKVITDLFKPHRKLKPISFADLPNYPWTVNVSAEYPYSSSKKWKKYVSKKQSEGLIDDNGVTFHNLYNEIFDDNRLHIHRIKDGHKSFWTEDGTPKTFGTNFLHTRAHLVKQEDEDKNRAVFGVPKLLLMAEQMFIWNLQRTYLNAQPGRYPMLWGFETIRGGWKKLYRYIYSKNPSYQTALGADWSGFDRFALHEVIDDVHNIWKSYFTFEEGYESTNEYPDTYTNPEKLERLWKWMTYSIKHNPITAQSGRTYMWLHNGIASGYQQTQLLDSFVNGIYLLTCLSACGVDIESKSFILFLQGDDSLCVTNADLMADKDWFLNTMSKEAKRRFNATLKPEKTSIGRTLSSIEVLSYANRFGIAYRDPDQLLAQLLYPERPRLLPETASAALGIATAAMGMDRKVYDVCLDVFNFITGPLGREPSPRPIQEMERAGLFPTGQVNVQKFPTFEETFFQNWDLSERTTSDKERLWPTSQYEKFYFLHV